MVKAGHQHWHLSYSPAATKEVSIIVRRFGLFTVSRGSGFDVFEKDNDIKIMLRASLVAQW